MAENLGLFEVVGRLVSRHNALSFTTPRCSQPRRRGRGDKGDKGHVLGRNGLTRGFHVLSIRRWDGMFLVGRAALKEGINTTFTVRGGGGVATEEVN